MGANNSTEVKVDIVGQDKTGPAFQSASKNAQFFGKQVEGVGNMLKSLGIYSAIIAGIGIATAQFKAGMQGFAEEANIISLTNERLKSAGMVLTEVNPKIDAFVEGMENLGVSGEESRAAVGRFALATRDMSRAFDLTKLAADLAASGYGTVADNTDRLTKVLSGQGQRALMEYRIKMEGTHSVAEQLAAIQTKVTRTTEEFADSTGGTLAIAAENWDEFRKAAGKVGEFFQNELLGYFNGFMNTAGINFEQFFSFVGKGLYVLADAFINKPGKFIGIGISGWAGLIQKTVTGNTSILDNASKMLNETWTNPFTEAENKWKAFSNKITTSSSDGGANPFPELGDDAEQAAKKMQSAFKSVASQIISSFKEQTNAVNELRKSLTDLDEETSKQLNEADKRYKQDVTNRAKQAKDRIDAIDKEIKDTQDARNAGWRTHIAELEAEKAKEQAILDKAGGAVLNLDEQLAKDDLTILKEKHDEENKTILAEADKKKTGINDEILNRQKFQLQQIGAVTTPGFLDKLTAEQQSFLGSMGVGPSSYIFNFNGDVNDKDKLIKIITDALDRQATLKGVAGQ